MYRSPKKIVKRKTYIFLVCVSYKRCLPNAFLLSSGSVTRCYIRKRQIQLCIHTSHCHFSYTHFFPECPADAQILRAFEKPLSVTSARLGGAVRSRLKQVRGFSSIRSPATMPRSRTLRLRLLFFRNTRDIV